MSEERQDRRAASRSSEGAAGDLSPQHPAEHPAFGFRLAQLTPRQLRAVLHTVGVSSEGELSPRQRLRLECYLGVLVDRYRRKHDRESVAPRVLRRMLTRPEKIFGGMHRHRSVAQELFLARWEQEGLAGAADAPPSVEQRPAKRVAAERFRLEMLTAAQLAAVDQHLRGAATRLDDLGVAGRIELESLLGVYFDALARGTHLRRRTRAKSTSDLTSVEPSWIALVLRRPEKVFRDPQRLVRRAADLALERRLEEAPEDVTTPPHRASVATAGLRPGSWPEDSHRFAGLSDRGAIEGDDELRAPVAPTLSAPRFAGDPTPGAPGSKMDWVLDVDPSRHPALVFRLDRLTLRQRRVVARWWLRQGVRVADPDQVIDVESLLGIVLDALSRQREAPDLSARLLRRILSAPHTVLRGERTAHYLATMVARERRLAIREGREVEPAPFPADAVATATTPGYWLRRIGLAATDIASAGGRLRSRLLASRPARAARQASDRVEEAFSARGGLAIAFVAAVGFVGAQLLHSVLFGAAADPTWYEGGGWLLGHWLLQADPAAPLGVLLLTAALAAGVPWHAVDDSRWLRAVVLAVALALAASTLLLPPNPYFGTGFWLDRVTMATLLVLSIRHPAGLPLLLIEFLLQHQQLRFPELTLYHRMHYPELREPAVDLLVVFLFFAFLRLPRWRLVDGRVFLLMATASTVSFFWDWGVSLVRLGPMPWTWVRHEELGSAWVAAWQHGWLSWVPEAWVVGVGGALNLVSPVPAAAFLVGALGSVAALLSRRVAVTVFTILALTTVAYGLFTGIFLWGWFLAAGLLALVFFGAPLDGEGATGTWQAVFLGVAVLLLPHAPHGFRLAAFHTPLVSTVRIEAVDDAGQTHEVRPEWLAPYDKLLQVQAGMFGDFGLGSRGRVLSAQQAVSLEARRRGSEGRPWRAEDSREVVGLIPAALTLEPLDELLRRALQQPPDLALLAWREQPWRSVHPLTPPSRPGWRSLRELRIRSVTVFWNGDGVQPIADAVIHRVSVAAAPPSGREERSAGSSDDRDRIGPTARPL